MGVGEAPREQGAEVRREEARPVQRRVYERQCEAGTGNHDEDCWGRRQAGARNHRQAMVTGQLRPQ